MIGDRIRQFRIQKNLSLSELAERAGVAKSYLSAIERYIQVNPSIQVLERLAGVLSVPVHVLIEDDADHGATPTEGKGTGIDHFDPEWLNIVREAMHSGVSKEDFREFLEFQKWRHHSEDSQH